MKIRNFMGTININGETFTGNNISITSNNGKRTVYIDGKEASSTEEHRIKIEITGDAVNVKAEGDVTIKGVVLGNVNASRDISCDSVGTIADAGRDIRCSNIGTSADAGRDVICSGNIRGNVNAGRDVSK
jgi:hypothetical protein